MSPELFKFDSLANRRFIFKNRSRFSHKELAEKLNVPLNYVLAITQAAYLYCRICGETLPCLACALQMRSKFIGVEPPAEEAKHCDLDPEIQARVREIQDKWSPEEELGKRATGHRQRVEPLDENTYRIVILTAGKAHAVKIL